MIQSYALWPHKTVADNLAFPLILRKMGKSERDERITEALSLVEMLPYANRFPFELSGGQQQRVALARALVYRPPLLLLDEPLSNKLRAELTETEALLKRAEAADEAAWTPHRAAEKTLEQLTAEVRALDKLAPPDAAKYPPVLASIEVEPGYERALAAALGDDIDASTNAEAPARWTGAELPTPALPATAASLTRFVKAPVQLAARLALTGVVEAKDGAALAKKLPPGGRLVSREGDIWRWDGFVRRADAPQPAAVRLEHKNRLAASRKEVATAEEHAASAKVAWETAKAERQNLDAHARTLRAEAPKLANAEALAVRDAERLEAERARTGERAAELDKQTQMLESEIAEARALFGAATEAPVTVNEAAIACARANAI